MVFVNLMASFTEHCCCRCDSDTRQQQQISSAGCVLTPADYPLLCLVPGLQQQLQSTRYRYIFMVYIVRVSYDVHVPVCHLLLHSHVGVVVFLAPTPLARPGGEPCLLVVFKYDTCPYLTETLEVSKPTTAVHVPETGQLHQAFSSGFLRFFCKSLLSWYSLLPQLSARKSRYTIQITNT